MRRPAVADLIDSAEPFQLGDLTIEYGERRVTVAGERIPLTATEFQIVRELSLHAGRVITHQQLLRRVWGAFNSGDPQMLRSHMRRLRRKLGDDAQDPKYIFTELRAGYRMARPEASSDAQV